MKIRPSVVALTSVALVAVGASAAQARTASQATTAQMQAAKKVAMWYEAEYRAFDKFERSQARQRAMHRSLPSNMRGQDQLSTPGWSGELPF